MILRSCDSATPVISKIIRKKNIWIHSYWICNPATLRLLRFQKLLPKKIFFYIETAILRLCDSCDSKNLEQKKSKFIYTEYAILQLCDSCDSKNCYPKNISFIFKLWSCDPATLRLLWFQKLLEKKIFEFIHTESAILRLCDSCDSKNCYPKKYFFILKLRSCDSATPAIPKI